MSNHAEIACDGHAALKAGDHQAIEISLADEWSGRPGLIGYRARFDPTALGRLRGRVAIAIRCGDAADALEATVGPNWGGGGPILAIRREPAARPRGFAFGASKAAADLDGALRERLREPGAVATVSVTALGEIPEASGGLVLVGMPIGNQADLAPRALDVLAQADVIFAEDTRAASDALAWRGVRTPLRSCHDHNEERRAGELVERLRAGERVAYVSDAGLPLVSDPGFRLVGAAVAGGFHVTAVPGPSASLLALVLSGLPAASFRFAGFPPRKAGERASFVTGVLAGPDTTILYEAGSRIDALLAAIAEQDPDRPVALCRDLTKGSEAVSRGSAASVRAGRGDEPDLRGEYVLVVAGAAPVPASTTADGSALALVEALIAENCPTAPIVKALRRAGLMGRGEAYDFVEGLKARRREA